MHSLDHPPPTIEPFYFGSAGAALYGCYHAPSPELSLDCGLVLCNPMGHEYTQLHRAVRRLAALLASKGFPVLRFDFTGCGDSAGDQEDWSIVRWRDDVSVAVSQLRQRSGVNRICAVGLRLGGAISVLAGSATGAFDGMVLWDPVVRGAAYLEELATAHGKMLGFAHVKPQTVDTTPELLGFPIPETFRRELEQLDLLTVTPKPAARIFVIESHELIQQGPLCRYLESLEALNVQHQRFADHDLWTWLENFGRVHVPVQILRQVVAWVSAEYS